MCCSKFPRIACVVSYRGHCILPVLIVVPVPLLQRTVTSFSFTTAQHYRRAVFIRPGVLSRIPFTDVWRISLMFHFEAISKVPSHNFYMDGLLTQLKDFQPRGSGSLLKDYHILAKRLQFKTARDPSLPFSSEKVQDNLVLGYAIASVATL